MYLVSLIGGLALLVFGADLLVRHASTLAARLGVPSIVIGLTVVAFGTSAPELAISTIASLDGRSDLALGNVVGSNIYNVLLILGASALVTPLLISRQLVRIDVPVMIGVSVLPLVLARDGQMSRCDGAFLVVLLIGYTAFQILHGRARAEDRTGAARRPGTVTRDLVLLAGGLVLLVVGSQFFLEGAVELARRLGLSEIVIGLTIVAAGTSLPETATTMVAAIRGERDIAVGNVVGSNVFNVLGVLGVASVVAADGITIAPSSLVFDLPIMIAVAVACLPVFFKDNIISRWQGGVFLAYYAAYVAYLILGVREHDALQMLGRVLVYFAFPLTAITFGAIAWQRIRQRRRGS